MSSPAQSTESTAQDKVEACRACGGASAGGETAGGEASFLPPSDLRPPRLFPTPPSTVSPSCASCPSWISTLSSP